MQRVTLGGTLSTSPEEPAVPHAPDLQPPSPSVRGRRALLTTGATAALGALGIAVARPAEAAAGGAALLGRSNTSGGSTTTVSSSSPSGTFWSKATAGPAVVADTKAASKWAVLARNQSTVTGSAGAVRAEGGRNTGVHASTASNLTWAAHVVNTGAASDSAPGGGLRVEGRNTLGLFVDTDPDVADVPALTSIGGDGEFNGTALLASGSTYLDGKAMALRSYTGVLGPGATSDTNVLWYAPVTSGEADYHTVTETVALDGAGGATVDLATDYAAAYAAFPVAVDMATLRIQLTAVGAAMPDLHAVWTPDAAATSFGVAGGTASGTVHFTISAKRVQVTLADVGTASAASLAAAGRAPAVAAASTSGRTGRAVTRRPR
jgi:hypothetical protein